MKNDNDKSTSSEQKSIEREESRTPFLNLILSALEEQLLFEGKSDANEPKSPRE